MPWPTTFTAFAFATVLRQMNLAPFSGIHLDLRCKYESSGEDECPTVALDSTLEEILDKLTLKKISFKMDHALWSPLSCAGFMLMQNLLHHYSQVLEVLTLEDISEHFSYWPAEHCKLPRLKTLKIGEENWMSLRVGRLCEPFTNFIKEMLITAPNLQELHSGGDIFALAEMLQETSVVLVYDDVVMPDFQKIPESLIVALRLQSLILRYSGPDFDFDRFNRVTPIVLQASTTTLRRVSVDAMLVVPLMCYGVCLENVKEFVMYADYDRLELIEPRLMRMVKHFDFTQIFPGLEKVWVGGGNLRYFGIDSRVQAHMSQVVEEAIAVLEEPLPYRASNIKQLQLSLSMDIKLSDATAQFFAEMFPSVNQLEVGEDMFCHGEVAFGPIWKHWKDLETLEVCAAITGNLDSLFCGIFPEEVAELEQMDDEYLKRVNIVPVMPSITCLRNLRTFTFKFSPVTGFPVFFRNSFHFSKVTGFIAFMRCPNLTVNLSNNNEAAYIALRHMEPYASFDLKGLPTTPPLKVLKSILKKRVQ